MTTCIVDISESTDHIAQVMESSYLSLGEFNCIMTELIYRISLSTYAESNLMNYVSELKDKYNLKQLGLGDYIAGLWFQIGRDLLLIFRYYGLYRDSRNHLFEYTGMLDKNTIVIKEIEYEPTGCQNTRTAHHGPVGYGYAYA